MLRISLFTLFILGMSIGLSAQDKSNRGKEFWLAYGYNYSFFNEPPVNNQELQLYISTVQAATVTISINNTGFTRTINIPANTVDFSVLIPKSGADDARIKDEGFFNRGIHIVSNVDVAVYAHQYNVQVSGATMLMPVETYGYSYYSVNYSQTSSQSNPGDWFSWFFVIASEDNTRLQITPSDSTKNGWLPGQTYTVNLNKGELYNVMGKGVFGTDASRASKDMTGSKVISVPGADGKCHPVGLFSGSGGIRLCRGDGGEYMGQQMFPSQAWGTRYLTYHMMNTTSGAYFAPFLNFYRVCVLDPTTVVKRNGVPLTGLIKNFYYEFSSTTGDYIESDKPILVSQYTPNANQCVTLNTISYGDPEMIYLSPIEQGQKSVLFYKSRKSTIDYVYASIYLPTIAVGSLRVDGAALPGANIIPHPSNPAYSVAVARLLGPAAQHAITCDSAFTSTLYGIGLFESYGYNAGTLINNLNNYSAIKNSFNNTTTVDTFTCVKTPVKLYAKLAFPATFITWKFSAINGVTPSADTTVSNPVAVRTELINNRTYYVYMFDKDVYFNKAGNYTLPITYGAAVIENCSQTENAEIKIVVKPGPVADFTTSGGNCLGDTVHFSGIANPNGFTIDRFLWNFDDSTKALSKDTSKVFATAVNQTVRFRIISTNGCLGDTSKQVPVNAVPKSGFKVNTTAVCENVAFTLTDTSTITGGAISSWRWDFGDGQTSSRTNNTPFSYTYAAAGTYSIQLITSSGAGCGSDTARKTVTVNKRPVAKFGYNRDICVGDSILITDTSVAGAALITNRYWSFGNGQTTNRSNNTPFYQTYATAGNYPVKLAVTDAAGCTSDTVTRTVAVGNKASANFTLSGVRCADSTFTFTSTYTTAGAAWYWNFGDGQTATVTNGNTTTHTFAASATGYTIKHLVNTSPGCGSDTAILTVPPIRQNPVVTFTVTGDTLCVGKPLAIDAQTSAPVSQWNWKFGTATASTAPPFNYSFANAGTYNINVSVKDTAGCGSLLATQPITIFAAPVVNAGTDRVINPGSSIVIDAALANASAYDLIWTPATYLNNNTLLNPTAKPDTTTLYTLTVMHKTELCSSSDKVLIQVISQLYIPTAFTPNSDGLNDYWKIPGLELYPDAEVAIYNRWGQLIQRSKNYNLNPWDGRFNGATQPAGLYSYMIMLNNSRKEVLKGAFTLLR